MIDAWQLDSSVDFGIGAFATILGLLVGSWLGVVTAAAIPFVWELFGSVYATIGTFLQDAWDSDFTNDLTCLFLEAASDTDGVVTFDWGAISQSLADRVAETAAPEDALLWLQLNYMVLFIGVEGLNAAGALTAIAGNCDSCVGTWCYNFDFTQNDGGWVGDDDGAWAVWDSSGWHASAFGSTTIQGRQMGMHITVNSVVTRFEIEFDTASPNYTVGWRNYSDPVLVGGALDDTALTGTGTLDGSVTAADTDTPVTTLGFAFARPAVPALNFKIVRITLYGRGVNPFGDDNCG
jgi:hypothetical protein